MIDGYRLSLTNRSDSVKALKKAQEHYRAALQRRSSGDPGAGPRRSGDVGQSSCATETPSRSSKPTRSSSRSSPRTYYKKRGRGAPASSCWEAGRRAKFYAPGTPAGSQADRPPCPARWTPHHPGIPGGGNLPKLDDIFTLDHDEGPQEPAKPDAPKPDASSPTRRRGDAPMPGEEPRRTLPRPMLPRADAPKTERQAGLRS